jgi:branched-subunit amino acid ABC-type transport system permease component
VQSVAMLVIVLAFLLLRPRGILGANVGAEA